MTDASQADINNGALPGRPEKADLTYYGTPEGVLMTEPRKLFRCIFC
jgi:hypothetical protein